MAKSFDGVKKSSRRFGLKAKRRTPEEVAWKATSEVTLALLRVKMVALTRLEEARDSPNEKELKVIQRQVTESAQKIIKETACSSEWVSAFSLEHKPPSVREKEQQRRRHEQGEEGAQP